MAGKKAHEEQIEDFFGHHALEDSRQ